MSNVYNIPSLTVNELVKKLVSLYKAAYEMEELASVPSVSMVGPMGVGKSSAVRSIASELSKFVGYDVGVTDIRLLNFSPVDLRGIPTADAEKEFTVWLKPKIFDLPNDKVHILFLEEISSAPQSLQAAAYQIVLDRRIGEFEIPDKTIILTAGNRTIDRSVAIRLSKALANRLIHFEVRSDIDSWFEWALRNRIDERIIGYLSFDNSKLNVEPDLETLAFPTPRSWEFVSRVLKLSTDKSLEEMHELIAGSIGVSHAIEFENWCKVYKTLPNVKDILRGVCATCTKEIDAIYALVSSLLALIKSKSKVIHDDELENVCSYVTHHFPVDFAVLFFKGLTSIDEMNMRLAKIHSFNNWMKINKRYL